MDSLALSCPHYADLKFTIVTDCHRVLVFHALGELGGGGVSVYFIINPLIVENGRDH